MFGIFHADLPIGRGIWLVVLTLIASSLITGTSLHVAGDPTASAVDILVFTGHCIVFAFLYNFVPSVTLRLLDIRALLRRVSGQGSSAVLFESYRYDALGDRVVNAAFVLSAALAAPQFGTQELHLTGAIGLVTVIVSFVLELDERDAQLRWPLVELRRKSKTSATARVFASGKLFTEISLAEGFDSVLVRLLEAHWVIWSERNVVGSDSMWLRKDMSIRRLKILDLAWRQEVSGPEAAKERWGLFAAISGMIAGPVSVIGFGLAIYLGNKYGSDDPIYVLRASGTLGAVTAALALGGWVVFVGALMVIRWSDGRSLLTGKARTMTRSQPQDLGGEPPTED